VAAASPGRLGGERGRSRRGRGDDVAHRRQLLVFDDHAVDRVVRRRARLGDDRDDRLADVARAFVRERAARRRDGLLAVGAAEVGRGRHRLDAGGGEFGAGEDREHARHRPRRAGIDRDDPRVRVRRALEGDDRLARLGRVVDKAAAAGEERGILEAMNRAPAAEARRSVLDSAHASAAHICWSRSAVQMRGSRWPVASS
jgi:hypothetical protein